MSSTSRTLTLADVALPRAGVLRDVLLVLGASIATTIAARLALPLPWSPVPLTGQTFAVLLSGALLGARRGAMSQALYLAQGALGLPVFAGGVAGAAALVGPTAGYLVAFPLAAWVTGSLAERGWDRRFDTTVAAMLAGSAVILACGTSTLALFVPRGQLLAAGVLPFVPGEVIKSVAAALVLPRLWDLARRSGPNP
jgi:biotin transport system substrate-specific component